MRYLRLTYLHLCLHYLQLYALVRIVCKPTILIQLLKLLKIVVTLICLCIRPSSKLVGFKLIVS